MTWLLKHKMFKVIFKQCPDGYTDQELSISKTTFSQQLWNNEYLSWSGIVESRVGCKGGI